MTFGQQLKEKARRSRRALVMTAGQLAIGSSWKTQRARQVDEPTRRPDDSQLEAAPVMAEAAGADAGVGLRRPPRAFPAGRNGAIREDTKL